MALTQGTNRTTTVKLKPTGGDCEILADLGYETGKVEFNEKSTAVVYHRAKADARKSGQLQSLAEMFPTRVFYFDLIEKLKLQISKNDDMDCHYPYSLPSGQVAYHNRSSHEVVKVAQDSSIK